MGLLSQLLISSLVGGVIGYVTNYVAVVMLFRPRKPRRIPLLGITIQGLIPSKKVELAESLALIARDYLRGPSFRAEVERGVKEAIRDSVRRSVTSILYRSQLVAALVPRQALDAIADRIADSIASIVAERIAYGAADRVDVAKIVREEVARLSDEEVEEIFRRIAGKQLHYIEIAGFILGALIGPVELILLKLIG